MSNFVNRRKFLAALSSVIGASAVAACSDDVEPGRYTQADIDLLAAQRLHESQNSGNSMFGEHRYKGYRGLAELPWFGLDEFGELVCIDDSIAMAIDVHCHLGMSVLFEPHLDLAAKTARVRHLLDCDGQAPGCDLDLDIYVNGNFSEANLDTLRTNMLAQGIWGSRYARSQTIPNLLREMDRIRIERAMILPIKLGLPFGDDQTEVWRAAINNSGATDRLYGGFSIHPRDDDRLQQIKLHAQTGAKIIKLHPTVQRFYPDDPAMMEVYELAEQLGLIIFFHGGRAGIEPERSHRYAMPRHYRGALANFPKLQFILGHAGARDSDAMLELALGHSNAWLGIHGQSVTSLDQIIRRTGGERLLFGSDWPFYHLGVSLAKVLITTELKDRRGIRDAILRNNAIELFEMS